MLLYSARLFFENMFLHTTVTSLYWSTAGLGYVFVYSFLQNIFSLGVASLHYGWCKQSQGFQFISPAILCSDRNIKPFIRVLAKLLPKKYHEVFFAVLLMGYCLLLNTAATSSLLSVAVLAGLLLSLKLSSRATVGKTHVKPVKTPSLTQTVNSQSFIHSSTHRFVPDSKLLP